MIIGGVVALLLIPLFVVIFLYRAAQYKQQATFVSEGTMEFVMAGEDLQRILLNVDGYVLTRENAIKPRNQNTAGTGEIAATEEEIKRYSEGGESWIGRYLREHYGFYWVSWLYPLKKIHRFEITRARLKPSSAATSKDTSLQSRIELDPSTSITDHLRFRFPRPFVFDEVESADRLEVNLLVMTMFQVVKPHTVVFMVGKEFFTTLEATIGGAVADYMKERNFVDFVKSNKGKGSVFSEAIKRLNTEPYGDIKNGIIEDLGVRIIDVWVEDYGLPADAKTAREATQALEIAELEGQADVKRADLERQAAELRAKGGAARIVELARAYSGNPEAAPYVASQIASENLKNLTVLSGGNLGTSIIVDPTRGNSTKSPPVPPASSNS